MSHTLNAPTPAVAGLLVSVDNPVADPTDSAHKYRGVIPIRDELLALARYWETEALQIEFRWFLIGGDSPGECNRVKFARQRVKRVAELVGGVAVGEAREQAREEFKERIGRRDWLIFQHGNEKEQIRYCDDVLDEYVAWLHMDEVERTRVRAC